MSPFWPVDIEIRCDGYVETAPSYGERNWTQGQSAINRHGFLCRQAAMEPPVRKISGAMLWDSIKRAGFATDAAVLTTKDMMGSIVDAIVAMSHLERLGFLVLVLFTAWECLHLILNAGCWTCHKVRLLLRRFRERKTPHAVKAPRHVVEAPSATHPLKTSHPKSS